jgi:lipid-binding SYLF domain-containing protein
MHRVSALLPSWDRSRFSSPVPPVPPVPTNTTNKTNTANSPAPAPPKAPGALTKVFGWAEKIVPATRISISTAPTAPTRYGRETYWPTSLDKECDKAARIIKSFCFDGFLSQEFDGTDETDQDNQANQTEQTEQIKENTAEPKPTPKYVTKKIPPRIIQNAVGLAVFSCMRSGLWMSGSGGAGLITARKADGTWSPPSAIILHTAELAFEMGVDIYDCVLVINSVQTLELFTRPRLVLGADVSLDVGPLLVAGAQDPEIKWKEISETVLTYVKARGKHQAVRLDGSMVTERVNENEKFYCAGVTILDILAGNIPKNVPQMRPLFEVIKAAEGRSDYDKVLMDWLAQQPAPGDADIESPRESIASITSPTKLAFGVPDANDPDPFGVIGLEMAGIEIREAGSKLRPVSTQFEYQPSPSSPLYGRFSRQSMDTFVSRSNRGSCMSARTQATTLTDACTQTDVASTTFSRPNSDDGKDVVERLPTVVEPEEVDYTQVDTSVIEKLKRRTIEPVAPVPAAPEPVQAIETKEIKVTDTITTTEVKTTDEKTAEVISQTVTPPTPIEGPSPKAAEEQDEDADDEDDDDEEDEPVVCEVATASAQPARTSIQRSQVTHVIQAKGAIVTIPKRVPPPLPARSPARASRGSRSEYGDVSSLRSPIRNSFLSIESRAEGSRTSLDETITTQEPTHPETDQGSPTHTQRPASPRHTKNTSSVCTAVAVNTASPSRLSSGSSSSPNQDLNASPSSAVPPTPQTLEPTSSVEGDSEKEPTTPQTAETDFDTASEHHIDAKSLGETKAHGSEGVRIVSATTTPVGSASEREREAATIPVA